MTPINAITLSGKLAEILSSGTTTVRFTLLHSHGWTGPDGAVHTGSFRVSCLAWGHARNSLLKYGKPGLEVVVCGRLTALPAGVGVLADSLTFVSPREVFKEGT